MECPYNEKTEGRSPSALSPHFAITMTHRTWYSLVSRTRRVIPRLDGQEQAGANGCLIMDSAPTDATRQWLTHWTGQSLRMAQDWFHEGLEKTLHGDQSPFPYPWAFPKGQFILPHNHNLEQLQKGDITCQPYQECAQPPERWKRSSG